MVSIKVITLSIILGLSVASCSEKVSSDPNEAYKLWAYENPEEGIKVLKGQYWQSAHWTREYIVYLKIQATDEWWLQYLDKNHITTDSTKWTTPHDAPEWFKPPITSKSYGFSDPFNSSRYFRDALTGECYIYEILL